MNPNVKSRRKMPVKARASVVFMVIKLRFKD
jgi:hypothetical protein